MSVRAKFKVQSVTDHGPSGDGCMKTVNLAAVTGRDGKGNESWSKWTPSGELRMTVTNPAAADYFKPGKTYFLDIVEAVDE